MPFSVEENIVSTEENGDIEERKKQKGPNLERRILGIASLADSSSHMKDFLDIHV